MIISHAHPTVEPGHKKALPASPKAACAALACIALISCAGIPGGSTTPASETAATGWPGVSLSSDREMVNDGRLIAQRECASCHAIDEVSASPNPSAPPLREVIFTNDPDLLAYRLIESMRIGHDEMPLFDFDVRSADALIAYIKSIGKNQARSNGMHR